MATRILRPLEYGDLLDELFDLYKSKFLLFTGIAAVVYFPVYMISYALLGEALRMVALLLSYPLSVFVAGASTYAVSQSYLGYEVTIIGAYRAVFRLGAPFFLTMFGLFIILCLGMAMCLAPGVILFIILAFVPQILVVENLYYGKAFSRSNYLTQGQWGRIFVVALLVYIIYSVISSIIAMPFMIPAMFLGMDFTTGEMSYVANVLMGFGSALSYSISVPIVTIPFVLLYYDFRVRKEGFDIEMLASSMGVSAPQQPASPFATSAAPSQPYTPLSYNPDPTDPNNLNNPDQQQ